MRYAHKSLIEIYTCLSKRCAFHTWYYNYGTWFRTPYNCDEAALSSGYCLFHDQSYWKDHPTTLNERLIQKIEAAIASKAVLFCIGYNLPEIKISAKFEELVYFHFAKFRDHAYFKGAIFDVVSFEGARFERTAVFQDAIFSKADFKQARFGEEANFQGAVFGEGDFSQSKFLGWANFKDVVLGKGAYPSSEI